MLDGLQLVQPVHATWTLAQLSDHVNYSVAERKFMFCMQMVEA
jgi:hypothetical protein